MLAIMIVMVGAFGVFVNITTAQLHSHVDIDTDGVARVYDEPTNQAKADAMLRVDTINGEDSTWFHNGEIIYPDYVQGDTLVVLNAEYLNRHVILNQYKDCDGSDGDIDYHLNKACIPLTQYVNYIRSHKQIK